MKYRVKNRRAGTKQATEYTIFTNRKKTVDYIATYLDLDVAEVEPIIKKARKEGCTHLKIRRTDDSAQWIELTFLDASKEVTHGSATISTPAESSREPRKR